MSITWVKRIGNGRRASHKLGQADYDVPFIVRTSAATDNQKTILDGLGITYGSAALPTIGQAYSYDGYTDSAALCVGHDISQVSDDRSSRLWLVMAEFSQTEDTAQSGNPTSWAARYRFGFAQFTKILERDLDNKAVVNSAGVRFDEPVEIDSSRPNLYVTKNVASTLLATWAQRLVEYKDAVNSDTFLYWPPKTVKVVDIQIGELEKWQTIYYYPLQLELAFEREGWQPKVANMSRQAKDLFDGGKLFHIEDRDGNKIIDPIFINPDGSAAGPGVSAAPNYIDFKAYKELPFAVLVAGLGISF